MTELKRGLGGISQIQWFAPCTRRALVQGGPLLVTTGVITPISGVATCSSDSSFQLEFCSKHPPHLRSCWQKWCMSSQHISPKIRCSSNALCIWSIIASGKRASCKYLRTIVYNYCYSWSQDISVKFTQCPTENFKWWLDIPQSLLSKVLYFSVVDLNVRWPRTDWWSFPLVG